MTIKEILTPFYLSIVQNPTRDAIGNFLDNSLIESKFIFISIWSIVHLLIGGLVYFMIDKFTKIKSTTMKFVLLFVLLLGYELVEFLLYSSLDLLFIPETFVDVVWDMIVGMLGGFLVYLGSK